MDPTMTRSPLGDMAAVEIIAAKTAAFIPSLIAGVLIYVVFHIAGNLSASLLRRIGQRRHMDQDVTGLLARAVKITCIVFGVVTGFGTMGVDVGALIAGLGLTGFALGFALKDLISNLLAGVLILLYRPFRRGDRILVTGMEGQVVETDLRYTKLSTPEKTILLPNSTLFNHAIILSHPSPQSGDNETKSN